MRICRRSLFVIVPLMMVAGLSSGIRAGNEERSRPPFDCGVLAIHTLSKLMGRPIELDLLRRHLPPTPPGGYSMKELRDAAGTCGLGLVGVRLTKDERSIDRPMVLYLDRGEHGHFLVVRPIGHTGKLVQMIDSVSPPVVLDKTALLNTREWTDLALIPDGGDWSGRSIFRNSAVLALLFCSAWLLARFVRLSLKSR